MRVFIAVTVIAILLVVAQIVVYTIELKDRDRVQTAQIEQNYNLILDLYSRVGFEPPNKTKRVMIPKN